ncbi:hypothetical protein HCTV-15_gp14 [Haloarcula virus HCTV-15]|nr:hypothetical protein HCTV-6_gp14 [Haloarcula virus HCTV-6]UBF22488.1 hypothetical protein HCTV-15_gp14 [Haloarcula virus HCTV-15]
MASSDADLLPQVRIQTGYSARVLDNDTFSAVMDVARRHIRTRKGIEQEWTEADWYDNEYREEALFWWTCLFAKVATGELDSQTLQVGAVDSRQLLAKEKGEVTTWFRNAERALGAVEPGQQTDSGYGFGIGAPRRDDRRYSYADNTRSDSEVDTDDVS